MKRIGIPEGMRLSGVVCIKKVETVVLDHVTEFLVDGFTRDCFGDILHMDILLAASRPAEVFRQLRELHEGAMFAFDNEPFSIEGQRLNLRYPELTPWAAEPFDLCLEEEQEKELSMDDNNARLESMARKIANRSKRQRHYFDDDDDVSPSRKVKGLWSYGRESYGLEKLFVYVPARSEIPGKELSSLLSRIDGKLERAGSFKRILCTYGEPRQEGRSCQGAFLKGHFKIGADQWLTALTLLTEPGPAPNPLPVTSLRVCYRHVLGSEATTRPRRDDPIIIVAPHRQVTAPEKVLRAVYALRKNLTWVFYDAEQGWSMESKTFSPEPAEAGDTE